MVTRMAAVRTLLLCLVLGTVVQANSFCLRNNPINAGFTTPCGTSNAFVLRNLTLLLGPRACVWGEWTEDVQINVEVASSSDAHYDPAVYIARDGGDAQTGTCASATLSPHARFSGTLFPNPGSSLSPSYGPFLESSEDHDGCGEVTSPVWRTLPRATFQCFESGANSDRYLEVGACISQITTPRTAPSCMDPATAKASMCSCQRRQVPGVSVCVDDEPLCEGDSGQPNTSPCEPVFSAYVSFTASALSVDFTPGRTYVGKFYFDYGSNDERAAFVYQNSSSGLDLATDVFWPCFRSRTIVCSSRSVTFSGFVLPRFFRERTDTPGCSDVPFFPSRLLVESAGFICYTKQILNSSGAVKWIWAASRNSRVEIGAAVTIDGSVWLFTLTSGGAFGSHLGDFGSPFRLAPKLLPNLTSVIHWESLAGNVASVTCPVTMEVLQVMFTPFSVDARNLITRTIDSITSSASLFGVAWPSAAGTPAFATPSLDSAASIKVALSAASGPASVTTTSFDYFAILARSIENFFPLAEPGLLPRHLILVTGYPHVSSSVFTSAYVASLCHARAITLWIITRDSVLPAADINALGIAIPQGPALASHALYMWKRLCPSSGADRVLGYCPTVMSDAFHRRDLIFFLVLLWSRAHLPRVCPLSSLSSS